jgi:hydrogenase expression/formation protein HypD
MKFISEYRNPELLKKILEKIKSTSTIPINLMEVCGTHTVSISRNGIREALPETITLLSGPGCPVCVTATRDIDKAIEIAKQPDVIMTTFGDMMKVPGSYSSFAREKAKGRDIRVVYSPLDALKIARENPDKKVVFHAVGFETTVPAVAMSILYAEKENISNYFILCMHKTVPFVLKSLLDLGEVDIHGFILPGHVSSIIGLKPYNFLAEDYGMPGVIGGFEPLDVLQTILMLVEQIESNEPRIEIQYKRVVRPEGNPLAIKAMNEVFEPCDSDWRGIGVIPHTGLKLREKYRRFDADEIFDLELPPPIEPRGCSCGEVLRGVKFPYECKLFGKACTPENPIGPCMVSSEGACAAYYRYDATFGLAHQSR